MYYMQKMATLTLFDLLKVQKLISQLDRTEKYQRHAHY